MIPSALPLFNRRMTEADAAPGAWAALSGDCCPSSRVADAWLRGLGSNRAAPVEVLLGLLDLSTSFPQFLRRADLPSAVMDAAVVHPRKAVRVAVAEGGRLSPEQWSRLLAATPEPRARAVLVDMAEDLSAYRASGARRGVEGVPDREARPPANPEEIAAMVAALPDAAAGTPTNAVWWIAALHADGAVMRRLASSPNRRIRRSVARAQHLPPDVVELLAHDEDSLVRRCLAESCDDAPPGLLLEEWRRRPGNFWHPGRPRDHPDFPRDGLLRFAGDQQPHMRLLALDDPASSVALVERFSRDPDDQVRGRAASDQRLPAGAAVRLTDDVSLSVRCAVLENPVLPPEVLASMLLDERRAVFAAGNPAIPRAIMHRMTALAAARH